MGEYCGAPNGKEPPEMTASELLELQGRARKYYPPQLTNFQRHFGTAERSAKLIGDACPPSINHGTAMCITKRSCAQCWLDWLNATAEEK